MIALGVLGAASVVLLATELLAGTRPHPSVGPRPQTASTEELREPEVASEPSARGPVVYPARVIEAPASTTPACIPASCIAQRMECGRAPDGCGGTMDCGPCSEGHECKSNKCVAKCQPMTCEEALAHCGEVDDGCGHTLKCGTCKSGETCGGGGVPNECGQGTCRPHSCSERGLSGGRFSDGCAGVLDC